MNARLLRDAEIRLEGALARLTFNATDPSSITLARVSVGKALLDIRAVLRDMEAPRRRLEDHIVIGECACTDGVCKNLRLPSEKCKDRLIDGFEHMGEAR